MRRALPLCLLILSCGHRARVTPDVATVDDTPALAARVAQLEAGMPARADLGQPPDDLLIDMQSAAFEDNLDLVRVEPLPPVMHTAYASFPHHVTVRATFAQIVALMTRVQHAGVIWIDDLSLRRRDDGKLDGSFTLTAFRWRKQDATSPAQAMLAVHERVVGRPNVPPVYDGSDPFAAFDVGPGGGGDPLPELTTTKEPPFVFDPLPPAPPPAPQGGDRKTLAARVRQLEAEWRETAALNLGAATPAALLVDLARTASGAAPGHIGLVGLVEKAGVLTITGVGFTRADVRRLSTWLSASAYFPDVRETIDPGTPRDAHTVRFTITSRAAW